MKWGSNRAFQHVERYMTNPPRAVAIHVLVCIPLIDTADGSETIADVVPVSQYGTTGRTYDALLEEARKFIERPYAEWLQL